MRKAIYAAGVIVTLALVGAGCASSQNADTNTSGTGATGSVNINY